MRIVGQQAKELAKRLGVELAKRKHKYSAVATTVDGIKFQSRREARRYSELKLLEKAGEIFKLELQVAYELHALGGSVVGKYVCDFKYLKREYVLFGPDSRWELVTVVEDSKGVRTELYRWKKRHLKAEYGIDIVEV